jgi:hypothetical protein
MCIVLSGKPEGDRRITQNWFVKNRKTQVRLDSGGSK